MNRKQKAVENAAAAWLGRRDGGLTAAEEKAWAEWLEADRSHRRAFRELEATSRALNVLSLLEKDSRFVPKANPPLRRPWAARAWRAIACGAAAALVLAAIGEWLAGRGSRRLTAAITTTVGEFRKVALPDGSTIALNTDSAVAVSFTPSERHLKLARGEAQFSVAKDPARPFVVEAHGVVVVAIGTVFDVRLRSSSLEVLVSEGRVGVNDARRGLSLLAEAAVVTKPPTAPLLLPAYHRATVSFDPDEPGSLLQQAAVAALSAADLTQALAWRVRRLEFDPTPLSALTEEFNRYNRHKLVVADPAISRLMIGGSFDVSDYGGFVRLLESSFGVKAELQGNETLLHGKEEAK